jgi:hypothetical protein
MPPTWRTAANTTITKNTTYTNVNSLVDQMINLHGKSSTVDVEGVHFTGLMVKGKAVTAQTSSWSVLNTTGLTFM